MGLIGGKTLTDGAALLYSRRHTPAPTRASVTSTVARMGHSVDVVGRYEPRVVSVRF